MTSFELFLNASPWLVLLLVSVPLAALMALAFYLTRHRGHDDESADFGKEALAIIAGGFVFLSAFAVVTSWNLQSSIATSVTSEFIAATSLAEDMGDVKTLSAQELALQLVTYAKSVKATEVGFTGIVGPSREAQVQLATIQDSVVSIISTTTLSAYQTDNLYKHLEQLKDARKARLSVSLPNLPIELVLVILISAALSLVGVSLYPPSRLKWVKYFHAGSALVVVSGMIMTIFVLQSPQYTARIVGYQIDLFTNSVSEGGANLTNEPGESGMTPLPSQPPGMSDGAGNPPPGTSDGPGNPPPGMSDGAGNPPPGVPEQP